MVFGLLSYRQQGVAALSTKPAQMTLAKFKDREGFTGVTVTPQSGEYRNVVIFCHGLGDQGDGWASMVPMFGGTEDTKYILPNAPVRPITLNGGMDMPGWSDVFGLQASDKEDAAGFEASRQRLLQIIDDEVTKNKIPHSRIALGGFSQGGALALYTALTSPFSLAGCVALSTWLPLRDKFPSSLTPEANNLRVFQVHGEADQVVSFEWGKQASERLAAMLTAKPPTFVAIRGMGHHADEKELMDVRKFLREIFA